MTSPPRPPRNAKPRLPATLALQYRWKYWSASDLRQYQHGFISIPFRNLCGLGLGVWVDLRVRASCVVAEFRH